MEQQVAEAAMAMIRSSTDASTQTAASQFLENWMRAPEAWDVYAKWIHSFHGNHHNNHNNANNTAAVDGDTIGMQLLCLTLLQAKVRRKVPRGTTPNTTNPALAAVRDELGSFLSQQQQQQNTHQQQPPPLNKAIVTPLCICTAAIAARCDNLQELINMCRLTPNNNNNHTNNHTIHNNNNNVHTNNNNNNGIPNTAASSSSTLSSLSLTSTNTPPTTTIALASAAASTPNCLLLPAHALRLLACIPPKVEACADLQTHEVTAELWPFLEPVLDTIRIALSSDTTTSNNANANNNTNVNANANTHNCDYNTMILPALEALKHWNSICHVSLSHLSTPTCGGTESLLPLLIQLLSASQPARPKVVVLASEALTEAILIPSDSCTPARKAASSNLLHCVGTHRFVAAPLAYATQQDWEDALHEHVSKQTVWIQRVFTTSSWGMVALQPKVSSLTWENSAFYFHDAFLHHADFAIDTLFVVADSINKAGSYTLSFDKGDKNKNKNAHLVKLICWHAEDFSDDDHPEGQIMMVPLNGDQLRGTSAEVAEAVAFSVAKLLLKPGVVCVAICTDSGGGGTTESVAEPLIEARILEQKGLVTNCCLHNMNLCFCVPLKKILLSNFRELKTRDVLQFIYTAWAFMDALEKLQNCYRYLDVSTT